jgi:4a-hydroxytetrahydrobiopterin dehydratase
MSDRQSRIGVRRWPSLSLCAADRRAEPMAWQARGEGCDDSAMSLLTEDEIVTRLGQTAGWERTGSAITRTVKLGDFRDAMLYVGAVAHLAQVANHHPDIAISWNRVTLTLSTHSAGGLTENDFALAGQINALP